MFQCSKTKKYHFVFIIWKGTGLKAQKKASNLSVQMIQGKNTTNLSLDSRIIEQRLTCPLEII